MAHPQTDQYFVPTHSKAPIMASVALFTLMIGVASWLNGVAWGKWTFFVGVAAMIAVLTWLIQATGKWWQALTLGTMLVVGTFSAIGILAMIRA